MESAYCPTKICSLWLMQLTDIFQTRGWALYRQGYSAETSQLNGAAI